MVILHTYVDKADHYPLAGERTRKESAGVVVYLVYPGDITRVVVEEVHSIAERDISHPRNLSCLREDIDRNGGRKEHTVVMVNHHPERLKRLDSTFVIEEYARAHGGGLIGHLGAALFYVDLHRGHSMGLSGQQKPCAGGQGAGGGRNGRQPYGRR